MEPRIPLEDYCRSCRCFMTGESCSKQANIRMRRQVLHNNNQINAFVIMNFSKMSDVAFHHRLYRFIESLSKYLIISKDEQGNHILTCNAEESVGNVEINIVRADSESTSNFIMCSRICQQIQLADLIIVDVSQRNTNVFYELGMAVAMGKLILPICYSESFYKMHIPEELEKAKKENAIKGKSNEEYERLARHIDCYPWRRTLFEHFGIRYRSKKDSELLDEKVENKQDIEAKLAAMDKYVVTQYIHYDSAINEKYGFSDIQYYRFPYHRDVDGKKIGQHLYDMLRKSYNTARYTHNTLVIYTMEGFLNEDQAGTCIINYYNSFTKRMRSGQCFYGDRVGVLVQENVIPESEKDAKEDNNIQYSVGEIIHLGMNQATAAIQSQEVKPEDYILKISKSGKTTDAGEFPMTAIQQFTRAYNENKCITIYPEHPVYAQRVENGIQKDLLKESEESPFFCLYHIMLKNLKYTNELVVDISGNSIQALFWLGAAHGSDVYAIAVLHEASEKEQVMLLGKTLKAARTIFDISGLWTAVLHSYDTEGFYRQLAQVQLGIDQHTKPILLNAKDYEKRVKKVLFGELENEKKNNPRDCIANILQQKEKEEIATLENYYRDRFWKSLLRYNSLCIYLPGQGDQTIDKVAKEHADSAAKIFRYLTSRFVTGEYSQEIVKKEDSVDKKKCHNFISIGGALALPERELSKEFYRTCSNRDGENSRAYFQVEFEDKPVNTSLFNSLVGGTPVQQDRLQKLQCELRKELLNRFHPSSTEEKTLTSSEKVIFSAAEMYLSTVLYRYFLPLITIEEEHRICNGLEFYLRFLVAAKLDALKDLDEESADTLVTNMVATLKNTLETL